MSAFRAVIYSYVILSPRYHRTLKNKEVIAITMDQRINRKELRHDRHTVSLLTDHLVITPKYRGKILTGEVAFVAEAIIRATRAEISIKIIDMAVNVDHVHIFSSIHRNIP